MKYQSLLLSVLLAFAFACSGSSDATKPDTEEYADAMASEHEGEKPGASGAVKEVDPGEVVGTEVVYATGENGPVKGYLAQPTNVAKDAPAIIVIHEWWGLNENVRNMTDQLANLGYTALAVDIYDGKVADKPEDAKKYMQAAFANMDTAKSNIRQAFEFLQTNGASNIGVVGWCFGGHWALQTGMLFPKELDAMVIYYGKLITDKEALKPLEMPILGHFGAEDQGIPLESVKTFEKNLKELDKEAQIHVYEGANHAFANPSGQAYDKEAAEKAWERTKTFFAKHL